VLAKRRLTTRPWNQDNPWPVRPRRPLAEET